MFDPSVQRTARHSLTVSRTRVRLSSERQKLLASGRLAAADSPSKAAQEIILGL
jgi:hypothetical protein